MPLPLLSLDSGIFVLLEKQRSMKKYLLPFAIIFSISLQAQSLIGAWEASTVKDGKQLRNVVIFADGYQAATYYDAETGAFVSTNGGTWQLDGNTLTETVAMPTGCEYN